MAKQKPINSMDDLFLHTLQDIYFAEQQIAKNLPTMAKKSQNPALKQGFETHLAGNQTADSTARRDLQIARAEVKRRRMPGH